MREEIQKKHNESRYKFLKQVVATGTNSLVNVYQSYSIDAETAEYWVVYRCGVRVKGRGSVFCHFALFFIIFAGTVE